MKPNYLIILIVILLLGSCGRPSWVLPENKMEDVLFDIHLADATIDRNYSEFNKDPLRKQELYNSVFQKHNITPQQFDTSLVWYSQNLTKYMKMYERIGDRYNTLSDSLDSWIRQEQDLLAFASTSNIWEDNSYIILNSPYLMNNTFTFRIDSATFEPGDIYELHFELLGLNKGVNITACLSGELEDTVFIRKNIITGNNKNIVYLPLNKDQQLKSLKGYFHLEEKTPHQNIIIYNLRLDQRKSLSLSEQKIEIQKLPEKNRK